MSKEPAQINYDKKIKDLEEELVRKDDVINSLKKENELLLKTAFKNSEKKIDAKLKKSVEEKK